MSRESMVGPLYSATRLDAPPSPIIPSTWSTRSFAKTPRWNFPVTLNLIDSGTVNEYSSPVARRFSPSVVPIPNASAPSAPCVQVCESVATAISPGSTNASSEAIVCSMPSPSLYMAMPWSFAKSDIKRMPWLTLMEHEGTVWSGMNAMRDGLKTCSFFPDSV